MSAGRVAVLPRNRGEILVRRESREDESRLTPLTAPLDGDDPATAAQRCLHAETGIAEAAMAVARVGEPVGADDDRDDTDAEQRVHPVLVDVETRDRTESAEWAWVAPPSLRSQPAVPWLWTAYDAVRPTVRTVADDTIHGSTTLSVRALELLRDEAALASDGSGSEDEPGGERVRAVARALLASRPAMTAVSNRVNRAMAAAEDTSGGFSAAVARAAHEGIERAVEADEAAAANAADGLPGNRIATLSRSGTVLAAIEAAAPNAVLVAESRPGGEGVDVAEALASGDDSASAAPDVTLTTDAAFPAELVRWEADALLVGADTVLPDGSVRNKVGTSPAAAVATREDVPVLAVTATDKISPDPAVEYEEWPGESPYDGDAPLAVANPTFDVTPAACVDAVVTERGALDADDVVALAAEHRKLAAWDDA